MERHSPFGYKCPVCKKLFPRQNIQHGCKVESHQMICFDNNSGVRGEKAEQEMEAFKRNEVWKKMKHLDTEGKEVPINPRRNYLTNRSTKSSTISHTLMTEKDKDDARKLIECRRKETVKMREVSENKENKPLNEHELQKKKPKLESRAEKLEKIKSVLQDLSSELGEILSVTFETSHKPPETSELQLHVSEEEFKEFRSEQPDGTDINSDDDSSSSSSSSSTSTNKTMDTSIVVAKSQTMSDEVDTYLKYLQDCQENMVVLNIGGVRFETSKNTLRADPSSVFALMLNNNSAFRPCKNVYTFDRDPAHFKIILNYLRNNCLIEKRYLPREHHYLNEIALEAKFYKLFGLKAVVEERLADLCACRLNVC